MSQSVERAARLLLWLSDRVVEQGETEHSLKALADGTGLDKATAYRLVNSLAKYGLVRRDEKSHTYQLGAGAMRLGRAAGAGHALVSRCMPHLHALAERTSETISLSERQQLQCVTIHEIESREVVRYANTIGRSVPLHVAAGARAVLAFSDEKLISEVLNSDLQSYTDLTVVDRDTLRQMLEQTRARGYAASYGERTPGVYSISAPVLTAEERAGGSVSILWPSRGKEIDEQRLRDWPELLLQVMEPVNQRYVSAAI